MRIVIGVDLRSNSQGALRFLRWLMQSASVAPQDVVALHTIETDHLLRAVRPFGPGTLPDKLLPILRETLDAAGLEGVRGEIVEADDACEALSDACERHEADLMVLGRRGTASSFVRLGRTVRRMLRQLPVVTIVAPAELETPGLGPVVLASDLGPTTAGAAAFAEDFASKVGTSLLAATAIPTQTEPHTAYLRAGLELKPRDERVRDARERLAEWIAARGLPEGIGTVVEGDLVESLLDLAEHRGTPLLVFGSREMGLKERLYLASAASTAAGLAKCAVAVVPSTES